MPKKRWLLHGLALPGLAVLLAVWRCPLNFFFHIPCPGCGLTRAHLALLRFDVIAAFRYHPLFWTALPAGLLLIHRRLWEKKVSPRLITRATVVLAAAFAFVYLFRLFFVPGTVALLTA